MQRGNPDPARSLLHAVREVAIGGQKHVLGYILRCLEVSDDALCEAHDGRVLLSEEAFKAR